MSNVKTLINLTPFIKDIENILYFSDRPEEVLAQKIRVSSDETKQKWIIAMIGKLVEQSKIIKLQRGNNE
ncbi:hypothetical protein KKJ13_20575 [Xenorhabdus bovienii]|uniref:hypothetical protein n=1 Tax=Xenorhabdus bovienii TaxID=40576 RepID=UPI00237CE7AD|nr:hypothetical protein [Xenorhabdus bovienii]MDE1493122.1 hypothetical protein [Xenorhabdus bovienii]MDE9443913.1 hypothetical protein [Xenorhabdus bovienii]